VALKDVGGDKDSFAALAKMIAETSEFNLVLMSDDAAVMAAGVEACGFKHPVIYAATEANADDFGKLALDNGLPLAVKADSIDGLVALTDKLTGMGLKDLILDPVHVKSSRRLRIWSHCAVRHSRTAIDRLGFRPSTFPCEMASNTDMEALVAGMYVSKYGGIVVLSDLDGRSAVPVAA
jgi:acetyl-CoA decarbonylase/synthase complex subunit gamma